MLYTEPRAAETRGNTRWHPKGVATDIQGRDTVNLCFPGTGSRNHNRAVQNHLLQPRLDEVEAILASGHSLHGVGGMDEAVSGSPGIP